MSRDHSNVDTNSIISIIKGTIRGKIAVGCVIIAIISGFSQVLYTFSLLFFL